MRKRLGFALDPESIVALFSQTGAFDSAFSVAITLKVDMSSLFQVLTTKCVDLESNGFSFVLSSHRYDHTLTDDVLAGIVKMPIQPG